MKHWMSGIEGGNSGLPLMVNGHFHFSPLTQKTIGVLHMNQAKSLVVGLAARIAAGKTTAATFLRDNLGFEVIATRDIIGDLITADGRQTNDTTLREYGASLMTEAGSIDFCNGIIRRISPGRDYVIDALRPVAHYDLLKQRIENFCLFYIHAPANIRRDRFVARGGTRDSSIEAFQAREEHPVEQEVALLMDYADVVFVHRELHIFRQQLVAWVQLMR